MELDKAIQKRHSTRKFKQKAPDWKDIIECINSARFAPMAGNNYSVKFILIKDKETIQKLADAAQQQFIAQTSYVVAVCSNTTRTLNLYGERGKSYLKQQAGAAVQNFLLKIEEKGLATCWIGYFVDYLVKEALKIPPEINIEAIFPVGYSAEKLKPKRKIDLDNILYFDKYNQKKMKPPKTLEV
ncbi:MAG: nitroreductase family protein [Nanoarchaeota archaeon]|nr:nitroreductase family protein [Nanoarchaeota archaeon]MBU1027638.1 nitroreductase family protein [Nanoarchaeota archaeon]